ncbi:hypothetical protein jhhlp_001543 [Lomentospora prolificans]|uniref:Uncharacterized protein n=1 Tax=Lomentospora prolificans TaxID=41688 RepID=A0A2N3NII2_9PEZI|nr:hypothetical protein jhhlp_001543 [Lomentospora prolificans]
MATWKERGEVPDSEDEFGSDSDQDIALPPIPAHGPVLQRKSNNYSQPPNASEALPAHTSDIWDLPASSQKENIQPQPHTAPGTPRAPYTAFSSSPLSEPPSELGSDREEPEATKDIAPITIKNYVRLFSPDPLSFSPKHGVEARPRLTKQPRPRAVRNETGCNDESPPGLARIGHDEETAEREDGPSEREAGTEHENVEDQEGRASTDGNLDLDSQEALASIPDDEHTLDFPAELLEREDMHVASRTFRPRKPIQKHPYALENALYSKIFKSHGLKPVRLEAGPSQRQRKDQEEDSQELEFEEETQETGDNIDPSDESQLQSTVDEADIPDDFGLSSPFTPIPSLLHHQGGLSSQPSVNGTDNTSVDGDGDLDEFPSLEKLMKAPTQNLSAKSSKRKSLTQLPVSTKRSRLESNSKRRDGRNQVEAYGRTPSRTDINRPGSHQSTSPPRLIIPAGLFSSSPPHPSKSQHRKDSPLPQSPAEPVALKRPQGRPIDLTAETDDESGTTSDPSSDGSDSEVIRTVGKYLRGVLPPSYLRLNEKKDSKAQRAQHSTRPGATSPGKLTRRGVAQRRTPGSEPRISRRLISDLSDDEEEAPAIIEDNSIPMIQRTLILQPAADMEDIDSGSDSSIMEDNRIEAMLPARKRSTPRQGQERSLKPAKRPKLQSNPVTQSRITSHFGGHSSKTLSTASVAKPKTQRRSRGGIPRSRRTTHRNQTINPIPKLGILDVIEPGAPQFLKIAARTAKQSTAQGRSSPTHKVLQMATRWDHVDVNDIMQKWKGGQIKPRELPPATTKHNAQPTPRAQPTSASCTWPITKRSKVVKQVKSGSRIIYEKAPVDPTPNARQIVSPQERRARREYRPLRPVYRPAQLETDCAELNRYTFHLKKRELDNLWRRARSNHSSVVPFSTVGSILEDDGFQIPSPPATRPEVPQSHATCEASFPAEMRPAATERRSRFRKQFAPKGIDTTAPQFSYANEPLPQPVHLRVDSSVDVLESFSEPDKLRGLGPFGTLYTHHFEIFPLDADVFFHESTLIGQGRLDKATDSYDDGRLRRTRPRVVFDIDGRTLRWGSWDEQVSSEVGILMDWIADHFHTPSRESDLSRNATVLHAANFILSYVQDSMGLPDISAEQSFAHRIIELLNGFQERLEADKPYDNPEYRIPIIDVLSRILTLAFTCTHICRKSQSLIDTCMLMEDLLIRIAKLTARALLSQGVDVVRDFLENSRQRSRREMGLRPKDVIIHCWVTLMRTLEVAHIPRSGFWDIVYSVLITDELTTTTDFEKLENLWRTMFSLLPLREFDSNGAVMPGIRRLVSMDGWALPQRLIKRVFDLYKQNKRQAASFNDYCRALIGRCLYLTREWGWFKCGGIIGTIFDFFGSQDLSHLRNEEAFKSPRFLEELVGNPSLAVEPEDKCFHIFLKFVALVIKRLKDRGGTNEIRNLVARLMPNHSRVYLKEQALHSHDLASLRNHHDLLCTLFWAAPPQFRPGAHILEALIKPADSHKDACLVNLRAWNQLARYVVATENDPEIFRVFRRWQSGIFGQLLEQFKNAESDAQEQYFSLSKDDSQGITQARIELVVKMNRAVAKEILYACLKASLDTMPYARSLAAATFALNSLQLEEVFNHFSLMPITLDWAMLRTALETTNGYLAKVDAFLNAPTDNVETTAAISQAMTVLYRELSPSFFSMARCVLGSLGIQPKSATAAVDKEVCSELAVTVSAKLLSGFAQAGLLGVSQAFGRGKCSLFQVEAHKLSLSHRRYLPLFIAVILKQGLSSSDALGPSLLNLWLLAIVKPKSSLAYESQLAEQLKRRGEAFVPDSVVGLSINPDYVSNRELFEYAVSWMRQSVRQASPSAQKSLVSNFSTVLRSVMEQIRFDLKVVSMDPIDHPSYVAFIREIISLIRSHCTDICAIDEFFYQINKEYSPSLQDPQLHVAGIVSYGLRLGEGDTKVVPQLFYYLYNNFKVALINNRLGSEARMLRKGMENSQVLGFVFAKMLPAIAIAATRLDGAYVLLDVYCEGLTQLLTRHPASRELSREMLPDVLHLLHAILRCLHELTQGNAPLVSAERLHVACRLCSIKNILWPSLRALSYTNSSPPALREIQLLYRRVHGWLDGATSYLGDVLSARETSLRAIDLFGGLRTVAHSLPPTDPLVATFVDSITTDVRRNWIITEQSITIQAPGKIPGSTSTQSGQGIVKQPRGVFELIECLNNELKMWNSMQKLVLPSEERPRYGDRSGLSLTSLIF